MIEKFPVDSRIWIFQNNKKFTFDEEKIIKSELSVFMNSWNAHGNNLTAGFEIKHNLFIIVAANENKEKASGCSIDSLVNQIKKIENLLDLRLLDRSLVSYFLTNNKEEIFVSTFFDFKKKIKSNQIVSNTFIFNNTVATLGDYLTNWIQPIQNSWAKIYF